MPIAPGSFGLKACEANQLLTAGWYTLLPVISGLFICPVPDSKAKQKDPENYGLLPNELEAAIKASIENGAKGICLFTPDRMTKGHWKVFEKAIYKVK